MGATAGSRSPDRRNSGGLLRPSRARRLRRALRAGDESATRQSSVRRRKRRPPRSGLLETSNTLRRPSMTRPNASRSLSSQGECPAIHDRGPLTIEIRAEPRTPRNEDSVAKSAQSPFFACDELSRNTDGAGISRPSNTCRGSQIVQACEIRTRIGNHHAEEKNQLINRKESG
jgi:hypothetical protein